MLVSTFEVIRQYRAGYCNDVTSQCRCILLLHNYMVKDGSLHHYVFLFSLQVHPLNPLHLREALLRGRCVTDGTQAIGIHSPDGTDDHDWGRLTTSPDGVARFGLPGEPWHGIKLDRNLEVRQGFRTNLCWK